MLDYKLVQAVATVVLEGGFEKAGRVLGLTQSAVSQRVKALEEALGLPLVVRGSPARATAEGARLVEHYLKVRGLEQDLDQGLAPAPGRDWTCLRVAVNDDSLSTWFLPAVAPLLARERILLDLATDDQEHTHALLRDGLVSACVSTRPDPARGCRCLPLGRMAYRCLASPEFAARWFPGGFEPGMAEEAPAVIYNRKDDLHHAFLRSLLGREPRVTAHHLPSSERFVDLVVMGLAHGMIPDQQSGPHLADGSLVDLLPGRCQLVALFWHVWDLPSRPLEALTRAVLDGAGRSLARPECRVPETAAARNEE